MIVGTEWLIEATGCNEAHLRDESRLRDLFERVIRDLGLKAVGAVWHKFPGEGGVTGLIALTESHLACHTYPEHRTATFNLYCCRTRPEWDWEGNLKVALVAEHVSVVKIERGESKALPETAVHSEISNLKFAISNPCSEITNLEFEISNTIAGAENLNLQSQIPNPKSKIATGGDA